MRRPRAWWLLAPVLAGSLALNAYQVLSDDPERPTRRPTPVVQEEPPLPCDAPERIQAGPYSDPSGDEGLCIELLGSVG
jgi:hypothetical protein